MARSRLFMYLDLLLLQKNLIKHHNQENSNNNNQEMKRITDAFVMNESNTFDTFLKFMNQAKKPVGWDLKKILWKSIGETDHHI